MDVITIIEKLLELNSNNPADCEGDLNVLCDINVTNALKEWSTSIENIILLNKTLNTFNKQDKSPIWKYLCANFYFLDLLKELLVNSPPDEVLSVQHSKLLKIVIKNIVGLGIRCNLQSTMPTYKKLPLQYAEDTEPILDSYNKLAATTYGLIIYLKCNKLRNVIIADSFKPILTSLYQIIYCPLKKPNISDKKLTTFVMTQELYNRFMMEKVIFQKELDYLEKSLLKTFYVRETMLLPESKSPSWLMKAIAQNLNGVICSPQGIETVAWAMLDPSVDYDPNDRGKNWRILDIIMKLILSFNGKPEFENICQQLKTLLDLKDRNDKYIIPFVNLYVLCVKRLYALDTSVCTKLLLPVMFKNIKNLMSKDYKFNNDENVTTVLVRDIHMIDICFVENSAENLPIELLMPSIGILFYLCTVTLHSSLKVVHNELKEVLVKFLEYVDANRFFDLFLFEMQIDGIDTLRNDIYLADDNGSLIVKFCDIRTTIEIKTKTEVIMNICKSSRKLYIHLFLYLLNILVEYEKYINLSTKNDLLEVETEFVLSETMQIKLVVYQLLSELSEDILIQTYIKENPTDFIKYLENTLQRTLDAGIHKSYECDSEKFQNIFTLVMILQALVMNSTNYDHYKGLLMVLKPLFRESINLELRDLLKNIIDTLENGKFKETLKNESKSEVEIAIDDVCDSLLPVRGHGLMTLTKLVECKNPEAIERKNYLLNIFQQNLKDNDSFIYLSAVNGLAAMGYVFPDIIINILTDEYSSCNKKNAEDEVELRMKLGEVLVRVTKSLGDMASKYKSILLNTFLLGAKDDDSMIRASSLSNLGEVCRVLGYKLGTIVTEILVCVHGIISTDKAVEARRAALTVIRQLLTGLEADMVTFLKDHILEIYRTLKMIYQKDKDDVMRLHAQLALEELNENVNSFLMTTPQLQFERTSVLPDSCSNK